MQLASDWLSKNYVVVFAVIVWIIVNVAKRPHPESQAGFARVFWEIMDRLSVLTADKLPGQLKLPLLMSPGSERNGASKDSVSEEKEK